MPDSETTRPEIKIEPLIVVPTEARPAQMTPAPSSIAADPAVYEFEPAPENHALEERDC